VTWNYDPSETRAFSPSLLAPSAASPAGVNIPVGIVAVILAVRVLPESRDESSGAPT
jgi:hypothetical protein